MKDIPRIGFRPDKIDQGFELLDLARLFAMPVEDMNHDPFQHHRLNFFAILFVTEGTATHTVDLEAYTLTPGECLVISKDQVQAFSRQRDYRGYLVLFTEEFLWQHIPESALEQMRSVYNYSLQRLQFREEEVTHAFLTRVQTELSNCPPQILQQVLAAHLSIFLMKLQATMISRPSDGKAGRDFRLFTRFQEAVHLQYADTRNARDYARELGVSYKHLNEICKSFTQMTAKSFVDAHVVLEAKRRLSSSQDSVKEIGFACGFDEPTNFTKYFQKLSGMSPGQFRGQLGLRPR